jgi:hypothetical protein
MKALIPIPVVKEYPFLHLSICFPDVNRSMFIPVFFLKLYINEIYQNIK